MRLMSDERGSYLKLIRNNKKVVFIYVLLVLYKFSLDFLYSNVIKYTDLCYVGSDDTIKCIIGSVLYFTIAIILPKSKCDIYTVFLNVEFIFTIAPIFCVLGWSGYSIKYALMVWACMVLQILLLNTRTHGKVKNICVKGLKKYVVVGGSIVAIFCLLVHITINCGFAGFASFNFLNTYLIRRSLSYPTLLFYVFTWCKNVIIPFFMVYFLNEKKYKVAMGFLFLELLYFMATGAKFILFLIPVVLGMFFLSRKKMVLEGLYTVFFSGTFLCFVLTKIMPGTIMSWINFLFGSRFLFYPAMLKFKHYDLFSEYPKVQWAEGLIGKTFSLTNLYKASIGNSVSNHLMKADINVQSNTGYLGESYAQFGFAGMLLMTLLLVFLLKLLKKVSGNLNSAIIVPLVVVIAVVLNDGALFTTILSYGYAVLVIMCACFNLKEEKGKKMQVDYSVQELFTLILKKWYLILVIAVFFGVISLPVSNASYQDAVAQYEEYLEKESGSGENSDVNMVELLMSKPSPVEDYVKISVTAFIFGIFIGCVVVLVYDFFSPVVTNKDQLAFCGIVDDKEYEVFDIGSQWKWWKNKNSIEEMLNTEEEWPTYAVFRVRYYKTPLHVVDELVKKSNGAGIWVQIL